MLPKLFFGFLITVVAIFALLLVLVIVGGIIAGCSRLSSAMCRFPITFAASGRAGRPTIVAIIGIAGTVGVFVAMLSLANGFKATLVASGSPGNALVMRAGSPTEMMAA